MKNLLFLIFFAAFLTACSSSKSTTSSENSAPDMTENTDDISVSLADRLRRVPGVSVSGSGPNAQIVVRGQSSLQGNTSPLFVVDGVPIGQDFSEITRMVNVADIDRIQVVKSSSKKTMYGSRGASGIIEITLKKK